MSQGAQVNGPSSPTGKFIDSIGGCGGMWQLPQKCVFLFSIDMPKVHCCINVKGSVD